MSYFEEYVETGHSCSNCLNFISPGDGFMRLCRKCESISKVARNKRARQKAKKDQK